ncbi:MAG: cyclase family protein [Clostridia bacterium]|nr:MAG: cyclase family protein [Clostridia bacterium]
MFCLYDISLPIYPEMPVYKDEPDKRPQIEITRDFAQGIRETRIILDTHTGTHLDAPLHVEAGGASLDRLDLLPLIGPCRVLDLTAVTEKITAPDLHAHSVQPRDFLLLKTRNSLTESYGQDFVYLEAGAARTLADAGVRGVGLDALGIERDQPGHETHKILLRHGIVVMEGVRLTEVQPGSYFLLALPLSLVGTEAAPCRAILIGPA